jgi:hypothetical protein
VLKPGGRLMISDIVLLKELPDFLKNSIEAYVGCLSGALLKDEYVRTIRAAGFQDVRIIDETSFPMEFIVNDPTTKEVIENSKIPPEKVREVASSIMSIKVYGIKPNIRT